jgi:hypothetical protein
MRSERAEGPTAEVIEKTEKPAILSPWRFSVAPMMDGNDDQNCR